MHKNCTKPNVFWRGELKIRVSERGKKGSGTEIHSGPSLIVAVLEDFLTKHISFCFTNFITENRLFEIKMIQ